MVGGYTPDKVARCGAPSCWRTTTTRKSKSFGKPKQSVAQSPVGPGAIRLSERIQDLSQRIQPGAGACVLLDMHGYGIGWRRIPRHARWFTA